MTDMLNLLVHGINMPCPKDCPPVMYELVYSCWEENPENRPTFSQILLNFPGEFTACKFKLPTFFDTMKAVLFASKVFYLG